jgi:hypothetical protein
VRARKVDLTQAEIVNALERVGCLVWQINGAIDLLVCRSGHLYLLECKSKRGSLTKTQEQMRGDGWPIRIVWSPDDALREVGL